LTERRARGQEPKYSYDEIVETFACKLCGNGSKSAKRTEVGPRDEDAEPLSGKGTRGKKDGLQREIEIQKKKGCSICGKKGHTALDKNDDEFVCKKKCPTCNKRYCIGAHSDKCIGDYAEMPSQDTTRSANGETYSDYCWKMLENLHKKLRAEVKTAQRSEMGTQHYEADEHDEMHAGMCQQGTAFRML